MTSGTAVKKVATTGGWRVGFTGPLLLCLLFLVAAVSLRLFWDWREMNPVSGDEPHYLVVARSIAAYQTLDVTQAYLEELESRRFYEPGLGDPEMGLEGAQLHAAQKGQSLYSIHFPGLPLLISPFLLAFGLPGVRLAMILIAAAMIPLSWWVSRNLGAGPLAALGITAGTTLCLPFLIAANQIYPDLAGGIIATTFLAWYLHVDKSSAGHWTDLLTGITIAFLPWLHLKFLPVACLTAVVCFQQLRRLRSGTRYPLMLGLLCSVSLLGFLGYNLFCFGNPLGPYSEGSALLNFKAFTVFLGLHLDQFHGIFLQNPLFLVAFAGLAVLYKRNPRLVLLTCAIYLLLVVPHALHSNWYGGSSFAGRFMWASSTVLMIPLIQGLVYLANSRRSLFWTILSGSFLLQGYFLYLTLLRSFFLYNRPAKVWLAEYQSFYAPWQTFVPAFYRADLALTHPPNLAWTILALLLTGLLFHSRMRPVLTVTLVIGGGILGAVLYERSNAVYPGAVLPGVVGEIEELSRVARPEEHPSGFLTFGPYVALPAGSYRFQLHYSSAAPRGTGVGTWDIHVGPPVMQVLQSGELSGTSSETASIEYVLEVPEKWAGQEYEMRVHFDGTSPLAVERLEIEPARANLK